MAIIARLHDWEAKLQLPVMGESRLSVDLKDTMNGQIPLLVDVEQQEDFPVYALMAAYEKKWANTAELGCLFLLGLFPYPVSTAVLLSTLSTLNASSDQKRRLWKRPGGVHQILSHLLLDDKPDAGKLNDALHKLTNASLLSVDDGIVTAFRPVAAYYTESFRNNFFDEWRLYQQQLVYYYDDSAASTMQAEQRFWLNCKKLLHSLATTHKQQAMDEVYRPQIAPLLSRSLHADAAVGHLKLYVLAGFFQQPWDKIDFCMSAETKGYIQAEVGQALYLLGKKQTALTLLDTAHTALVKAENWQAAGEVTHLLGRHAVTQQDMPGSIQLLQQSVTYAEQDQDIDGKVLLKRLRSLFTLYKKSGDLPAAIKVAQKAKSLLEELQQREPAIA